MALGVITEQGDLGLGFNPLNPQEEQQVLDESANKNKEKEDGKESK